MMQNMKRVAVYGSAAAVNLSLFGQALKANERNNAYLSRLSDEERIKLAARDRFLRDKSTTYEGSGWLGDLVANASYAQVPEREKSRYEARASFRSGS